MLFNYLGRPKIPGKELMKIAAEQVKNFGADIRHQNVVSVTPTNGDFAVLTADGQRHVSKYVILADGKLFKLAQSLNLPHTTDGVEVDRDGRTAIDRLYAIGRGTRKSRSAAIISAGAGAVTALDILSREAGKMINDFDVLPAE
jgi:thioredoxin reductase